MTQATFKTYKTAQASMKRQNLDRNEYEIRENNEGRFEIKPVVTIAMLRRNGQGVVNQVWAFLAANDQLTRKQQIAQLIGAGYNPNMVRTQTSRFYKTQGDKRAWLDYEKQMRDLELVELGLKNDNDLIMNIHYNNIK